MKDTTRAKIIYLIDKLFVVEHVAAWLALIYYFIKSGFDWEKTGEEITALRRRFEWAIKTHPDNKE